MPNRNPAAQHYLNLRQLFDKLKKKAGLPHARWSAPTSYDPGGVNVGPFQPRADEGNYTPRAFANQPQNELGFNVDNRATGLHGGKRSHKYDRFVVAHELGHLAAAKRFRDNPQLAQRYLRLTQLQAAPGSGIGYDQLPTAGQGQTTHQSPQEQYANDFAAGLGYRFGAGGPLSAAHSPRMIRNLRRLGLI